MADDVDKANEYLEKYINQSIKKSRSNTEFGSMYCVDCGQEIDERRRKAVQTSLCTECKERLERVESQYNFDPEDE